MPDPVLSAAVNLTPIHAAAVHGPYEDLAIALIGLISKVIEGQPPEVRKQLWEMYVEDVKAWRTFWSTLGK